jgi:hypothetical protein
MRIPQGSSELPRSNSRKGQVKMDPVKVQAITDWPTPTSLTELRSFIGFGTYYKEFIPSYSAITRPLHDLTKGGVTWKWGPDQQAAFTLLKRLFTSYPVLRNPDPTKRYILDTDASGVAMGATISQDFTLMDATQLLTSPNHYPQRRRITTSMIENYLL